MITFEVMDDNHQMTFFVFIFIQVIHMHHLESQMLVSKGCNNRSQHFARLRERPGENPVTDALERWSPPLATVQKEPLWTAAATSYGIQPLYF